MCWLPEDQVSSNRRPSPATWTPPSVTDGSLLRKYMQEMGAPLKDSQSTKCHVRGDQEEIMLFNGINVESWDGRKDVACTNDPKPSNDHTAAAVWKPDRKQV